MKLFELVARNRAIRSLAFSASTAILAVAGIVFVCGLMWQNPGLLGGGAIALCLSARAFEGLPGQKSQRRETDPREPKNSYEDTLPEEDRVAEGEAQDTAWDDSTLLEIPDADSADSLVQQMLAQDRYALLLRPETSVHLRPGQIEKAVAQLDEAMSIVPDGQVWVGQLAEQASLDSDSVDPKLLRHGLVDVEAVYLDRHPITNRQFQNFVDADGYNLLECWPEAALPALLGFIDQTGFPGPRYWEDGRYLEGEESHPVVGISWYEARAYAHWVGKRLPTNAEWTKACAWPVESVPGRVIQRRFPWGESYDVRRANLWQSGRQGTVPVDQYTDGGTMGGAYQMIGNVWEWSRSPLKSPADPALHVPEAMVSIRGGAFDTYFENQATCHYQSGEYPLSRKRNVGFRLALALSVLEPPTENSLNEVTLPESASDCDSNENTAC